MPCGAEQANGCMSAAYGGSKNIVHMKKRVLSGRLLVRGIPIDILRGFVARVEARGFTRAAEELGRTQPTISLQVKRLEELVEAPLFKKGGRFELSPLGEVCFDYGKRLLRLHDDMLDELGRNNPNDAIRIGMSSEFVPILAWRLNELRANAKVATTFEVLVASQPAPS